MGRKAVPTDPDSSNGDSNVKLQDIQEKYNIQWSGTEDNSPIPKDVPSLTDIKKVLPKHCFQPDLKRSYYYVAKDLGIVSLLYIVLRLLELQPYPLLLMIYIPIYWLLQGTMFWALFVLGHDCGHGSFSSYDIVNDITGTLLNTLICVPFYPWKLTHKHHHKNTGNIDKDEIFYPIRSRHDDGKKFAPWFCFGGGWWVYLTRGFHPRRVNHFNPLEPIFTNHWFGCTCSVASLAAWSILLCKYYSLYGLMPLLVHYAVPVFVFGSWLVMVTFLHHTEVHVPWYSDGKWDNVRGQLSSVDRDYGWAHHLTHHIGTHQIHHLFIKIPHYHLEEATTVFRKTYPHLVRISKEPILPSFFRMFRIFENQRHIGNETQVHWFEPE